jgi:site-specific recombinase XerD
MLTIPCHRNLRSILEKTPRTACVTILSTMRNKPWVVESYGNYMSDVIGMAGLPERCVLHGVRKASARRLAEAGCPANEIGAITGHKTLSEIQRYTKAADQKALARAAVVRLEERFQHDNPNPENGVGGNDENPE